MSDEVTALEFLEEIMEDYELTPEDSIADLIECLRDEDLADESEAQGHA